ncbi:hypothetical protein [Streptomyces tendae]|uniref:hypothetical protein n=1 Tax=Streptomyces tendae TaxID=1932 RepID=UPI003570E859
MPIPYRPPYRLHVVYEPAGGEAAELPATARRILSELLTGQGRLLEELRTAEPVR